MMDVMEENRIGKTVRGNLTLNVVSGEARRGVTNQYVRVGQLDMCWLFEIIAVLELLLRELA